LDRNFRLPQSVRPEHYEPHLNIDFKQGAFTGRQNIDLELTQPTRTLVLHQKDLQFQGASVRVPAGKGFKTLRPVAIQAAPASETVAFQFAEPIPAGKARLSMAWSGKFTNGLEGLYRASSKMAITQFEPTDARRVFPSFDEPAFKATWKLGVTVDSHLRVLNNETPSSQHSNGDRRTVVFHQTQPIASYVAALVVGDFVSSKVVRTQGGTKIRVNATADQRRGMDFALPYARSAVEFYEQYFNQPYAFDKMDLVAVPNFEAGAEENVGLVTFRETDLLIDPALATLSQKIRAAGVVDHELAHQWNGNLVTPKWWDDLWLNESFANFMSAKVLRLQEPGWDTDADNSGAELAMQLDALESTHPVHSPVANAQEANQAFDAITYQKGEAVLRMIEGAVGETVFRDGMRSFVAAHKFGNATADDLWREIEAASQRHAQASGEPAVPVRELADAWVGQKGFPLVSVERQGDVVSLAQRRFFAEPGKADPTRWPVPMVLRFEDAAGVHEQRVLLRDDATVKLNATGEVKWVDANGGALGYFRSHYATQDLDALLSHLDALAPIERVSLISDTWAQMKAGAVSLPAFLDLLGRFKGERNAVVLDELAGRISAVLLNYTDPRDQPAMYRWLRDFYQPIYQEVGWDSAPGEGLGVARRRVSALFGLGVVGKEPSISHEASDRVAKMLAGDNSALELDVRPNALVLAARHGDAKLFDTFLSGAQHATEPHERLRYLQLLAAFEDPQLAQRAVDFAFSGHIASQDLGTYFSALTFNSGTRDLAWTRMRKDWKWIEDHAGDSGLLQNIVRSLQNLPRAEDLASVQAFFKEHPVPSADRATQQTLERMGQALALRQRMSGGVHAWLALK
jgi:puromycin-sensitive aminopeptidase